MSGQTRLIEAPVAPRPTIGEIIRSIGPNELANGTIGFLFSATGPLAIVLSVAQQGRLSEEATASWLFGIYVINGLLTLLMSWLYRQPLCFFWTIPGTVLVGTALKHMTFAEVVGAYYATSLLILALGLSGWVKQAFARVPMPIVMAMVAGVFLRFGLDIVRALHGRIDLAGGMLAAFLILSAVPRWGKILPPVLGALIVGIAAAIWSGAYENLGINSLALAQPVFVSPVFSVRAMAELVIPIAITILVIQNGQGYAVLASAGHNTPHNATTLACGIGGLASAAFGAIGTCLTGPTNGIIVSSGSAARHFAGALVTGSLAVIFGLLAPTVTRLLLASPREMIMMLGGLAMLRVLQSSFTMAFSGPMSLGALVCFLVTVADLPVLNIGAPFWGLIAGIAVSALLERTHRT